MSKFLALIAGLVVGNMCIQQYQLSQLTDAVTEIKAEVKFIARTQEPLVSYSEKDEACLARNIYYEAGVESEAGKYSVAQVTLNRLQTKRWGQTICEVVYAKSQFSWTLKKKLVKPRGKSWEDSQWIARRVLRGDYVPSLAKAQFYHADYVKPKWRDPKAKLAQIGAHIFYSGARKA